MKNNDNKIPAAVRSIINYISPCLDSGYLNGDFQELYHQIYSEKGKVYAGFWIWFQVLRSLPKFIMESLSGS